MQEHGANLNIHYSIPEKEWAKITKICAEMPGWNDAGYWYGEDTDEKYILVSVEPGGLRFSAKLPLEEWGSWIELFKQRATEALGYEIGEPADGYDFKYWDVKRKNKFLNKIWKRTQKWKFKLLNRKST